MKTISVICSFLLLSSYSIFCQTNENVNEIPKGSNSIYVEAGGASLLYGVNYERSFILKKNKNKFNARIGFSNSNLDGIQLAMPVGASIDFGKHRSFFQFNFNRTFDLSKYNEISNFSIGVAYVRRPIRGFYLHASLSYLFFDKEQPFWDGSIKSTIWPGIGAGFSF
jgi:hypothetical protein